MNVYLLFLFNTVNWNMVVEECPGPSPAVVPENMSVFQISNNSKFFIIDYATSTDSNNAIARLGGACPYVTLSNTEPATCLAAMVSLVESQVGA